jgi:hypothetical protein
VILKKSQNFEKKMRIPAIRNKAIKLFSYSNGAEVSEPVFLSAIISSNVLVTVSNKKFNSKFNLKKKYLTFYTTPKSQWELHCAATQNIRSDRSAQFFIRLLKLENSEKIPRKF